MLCYYILYKIHTTVSSILFCCIILYWLCMHIGYWIFDILNCIYWMKYLSLCIDLCSSFIDQPAFDYFILTANIWWSTTRCDDMLPINFSWCPFVWIAVNFNWIELLKLTAALNVSNGISDTEMFDTLLYCIDWRKLLESVYWTSSI